MLETLIGTLFGGLFRLAPEALKLLDVKNERAHELSMFDKQIKLDTLRAQANIDNNNTSIEIADIQAIIEATKAQSTTTGIKWVDGLNSSIRPVLALQWLILLWPAVIISGIISAIGSGIDPLIVVNTMFGEEEKAMASSIASFWLVDRSLRKMGK